MQQSLIDVLKSIESGDRDHSLKLAKKLVAEYGENDLALRLYAEIDVSFNSKTVADLYIILRDLLSDNGYQLCTDIRERLVQAENNRKIEIAMYLENIRA